MLTWGLHYQNVYLIAVHVFIIRDLDRTARTQDHEIGSIELHVQGVEHNMGATSLKNPEVA